MPPNSSQMMLRSAFTRPAWQVAARRRIRGSPDATLVLGRAGPGSGPGASRHARGPLRVAELLLDELLRPLQLLRAQVAVDGPVPRPEVRDERVDDLLARQAGLRPHGVDPLVRAGRALVGQLLAA